MSFKAKLKEEKLEADFGKSGKAERRHLKPPGTCAKAVPRSISGISGCSLRWGLRLVCDIKCLQLKYGGSKWREFTRRREEPGVPSIVAIGQCPGAHSEVTRFGGCCPCRSLCCPRSRRSACKQQGFVAAFLCERWEGDTGASGGGSGCALAGTGSR